MTLRARLLLALAYVLLLAVLALLVPLVFSMRDRVDAEVRSQARAQADVVAATAADAPRLRPLVDTAARATRGRVIVVDDRGRVRADSAGEERVGIPYGDRPEIAGALRGDPVQLERRSETLDERLLATAVPILRGGRPDGAVRITQSVDAVKEAVGRSTLGLSAIGALVLGLGLAAGAVIAAQVARPLIRLDATARRVAAGDLAARAPVEGSLEQRRLAETFNEMTERLATTLASQREFVADASHQLRTPLTGLRLRIEEALATAGPEARPDLEAALAEVDRLSAIVSELLLLSQARDAGGEPERIDLEAALRDCAARWTPAAEDRGAALDVRAADAGAVRCPPRDLDRILDVLVENALHYGPPGQQLVLAGGPGRVEVLDEGPGPAPGEEDEVFARFHRGSAGRGGPQGTGLGLPIARELARRAGGDVRLARRTGGGAVATLELPSQAPVAARPAGRQEAPA